MRLSSIQIAGFKSFVEPTRVEFPASLTGIVGPNGCGKSNIIDAVRWVLGESARNIRGETLSDVIFDGSVSRAPLDQASIELVIDNSSGRVGGEYAEYAELKIRREVRRDAEHQSRYAINGVPVRRKDVADLFQGTGLGRGNYAIIAQGMVQGLIEARPEDMRKYIEEAAGISLYRERRRETENRIRHAEENLSRSHDILQEHEKQLRHLKQQKEQAEKYEALKQRYRARETEWVSLQLRERRRLLDGREEEHAALAKTRAAKEERLAALEAEHEQKRTQHMQDTQAVEQAQARFYQLQAESRSLQRDIDLRREQAAQVAQERQQLQAEIGEHQEHLAQVRQGLQERQAHFDRCAAELEEVDTVLAEAEQAAAEHEAAGRGRQEQLEALREQAVAVREARSTEQARLRQYDDELEHLGGTDGAPADDEADVRAALQQQFEASRARLERCKQALAENRAQMQQVRERLEGHAQTQAQVQSSRMQAQGRLASLEALQQSGLTSDPEAHAGVLRAMRLEGKRLADYLEVESGWEFAVETVLEECLGAFCVDRLPDRLEETRVAGAAPLMLVDRSVAPPQQAEQLSLASRVRSAVSLESLLGHVLAADTLAQACTVRASLLPHQSVVTRSGIRMGPDWVRFPAAESRAEGVLERQREIEALTERLARLEAEFKASEEQRQAAEQELRQGERQQAALQHDYDQAFERFAHVQARQQRVERQALRLEDLQQHARNCREALQQHEQRIDALERDLAQLEAERGAADEVRQRQQQHVRKLAEERQRLQLESGTAQAQAESFRQRLEREEETLSRSQSRLAQLAETNAGQEDETLQQKLEAAVKETEAAEAAMRTLRRKAEDLREALSELERDRSLAIREATELRERLHEKDMKRQQVRDLCSQLLGRLREQDCEPEPILEALPEEALAADWEGKVQKVARQLERMPPINAAAISEHRELEERRDVLERQHADIEQALQKLKDAMAKIDRETRERFRRTFEQVNENLKQTFPRIIGAGGEANLVMTDQNLLTTGIEVQACPPGKRRRPMHALSGGEQAMAAAALMLSLFMLNPAPFCILDEVDAPLSDDNLRRFCEIVVEMGERVQFVIVTHNKTTMEHVDQLIGVTMHEPGVSRLVSVDVARAVEMAAQDGA